MSAGVPFTKGWQDKAANDLTYNDPIPWQRSKPLTWDDTVWHTLADSYVSAVVSSRKGSQQRVERDSLGSLLLYNTINPVLSFMQYKQTLSYQDDITLQATQPVKGGGLGIRRVAHFMPFWLRR